MKPANPATMKALLYRLLKEFDRAVREEDDIDTHDTLITVRKVFALTHAALVHEEPNAIDRWPGTFDEWKDRRDTIDELCQTLLARDQEIADLKAEIKGITADFEGFRRSIEKDIADLRSLGGVHFVGHYQNAARLHDCPARTDKVCTDALAKVIEVALDRACDSINHPRRTR